jgi:hypothetical protein
MSTKNVETGFGCLVFETRSSKAEYHTSHTLNSISPLLCSPYTHFDREDERGEAQDENISARLHVH